MYLHFPITNQSLCANITVSLYPIPASNRWQLTLLSCQTSPIKIGIILLLMLHINIIQNAMKCFDFSLAAGSPVLPEDLVSLAGDELLLASGREHLVCCCGCCRHCIHQCVILAHTDRADPESGATHWLSC